MTLNLKVDVSCPYCGHDWTYSGADLHYATCPGCGKKVRLHPYVRQGYKPLATLKYPNDNYKMMTDAWLVKDYDATS